MDRYTFHCLLTIFGGSVVTRTRLVSSRLRLTSLIIASLMCYLPICHDAHHEVERSREVRREACYTHRISQDAIPLLCHLFYNRNAVRRQKTGDQPIFSRVQEAGAVVSADVLIIGETPPTHSYTPR